MNHGGNEAVALELQVEKTNRAVYPRRKGAVKNRLSLSFLLARKPIAVSRKESIKSRLRIKDKRTGDVSCAVTRI